MLDSALSKSLTLVNSRPWHFLSDLIRQPKQNCRYPFQIRRCFYGKRSFKLYYYVSGLAYSLVLDLVVFHSLFWNNNALWYFKDIFKNFSTEEFLKFYCLFIHLPFYFLFPQKSRVLSSVLSQPLEQWQARRRPSGPFIKWLNLVYEFSWTAW